MWTPTTREQHSRKALCYQTDLTDAEWVVIEPHLPPAHGTGRPRSWPMREIVNGIFYVMRAGCPWRLLPRDLPVPSIYSTVPPNDGSAPRHGHHFEPVDFVIDHGRGRHDAYSAGSCQRTYARACGCRQRPRRHREELIESERGWSGRKAFVTMMQTADLGQGNDRSGPWLSAASEWEHSVGRNLGFGSMGLATTGGSCVG